MIYKYIITKVHLRWLPIFNLHHNILISSKLAKSEKLLQIYIDSTFSIQNVK